MRTPGRKLYLATVEDIGSRKIVGHAMANRMTAELPLRALRKALLATYPDPPTRDFNFKPLHRSGCLHQVSQARLYHLNSPLKVWICCPNYHTLPNVSEKGVHKVMPRCVGKLVLTVSKPSRSTHVG